MLHIETQRLKLIPLTHELLQFWQTDRKLMLTALGLPVTEIMTSPEYKAELEDALQNFWIPQTAANPERYLWCTNWEIVLKSGNVSIGGIGFAGYPDENGDVETGFMLDDRYHGNGYALEALVSICGWAFQDPFVTRIVAQTYSSNLRAQQLLDKAGFVLTGAENELMKFARSR